KQHAPTFFVEREGDQLDIIILDHLEDTTQAKMIQFFDVARGLAQERRWKVKQVKEIIFIVEAWTSFQKIGEPRKYAQPADDPVRKEVLLVSKLTVEPPSMTAQSIEMLRDGSGDLVDLLPGPEE